MFHCQRDNNIKTASTTTTLTTPTLINSIYSTSWKKLQVTVKIGRSIDSISNGSFMHSFFVLSLGGVFIFIYSSFGMHLTVWITVIVAAMINIHVVTCTYFKIIIETCEKIHRIIALKRKRNGRGLKGRWQK